MQVPSSAGDLLGEHSYASVVAEISDFAIFLLDNEGRVASWNAGARRIFGYESEEIVGQLSAVLFTSEDRESGVPQQELVRARSEGRAEDVRWHLRKDGSRMWVTGVTTALHGAPGQAAGQVVGFAKVARDDTRQKEAEDDLRRSQERFQLVARATNDAIWDWNLATDRIWFWNENTQALFGYAAQEIDDSPLWWKTRVHPDDRQRVVETIHRVIDGGTVWSSEYRFRRADGSYAHVLDRGYVHHDESGQPTRILGAMTDVSLRKQIEEERAIYERLAHNSPDFIAISDLHGHIVYGNPAALRLVGMESLPQFQGVQFGDFFFPEDRAFIETEFLPRVLRNGEATIEIRFRHFESGAAIWMNYAVFVLRDGAGSPVALATVSRDISQQKSSEAEREELLQKLEFERGRLSAIFQTSPAFVAVLRGPQQVFEMANPNYYQLVGHRDIIGKPLLEALPEVEAQGAAGQSFLELLNGVLHSGVPFRGEEIPILLQRNPQGPVEERFVDLLYQPLIEADGTVSGVFSHGVDVTAQVRARQSAEAANRVKDEFLATLSHELRTPLTAIMGWANILKSGSLGAEDVARGVATIERNARAQGQLIEDILDVSRVITGKLRLEVQPVDLGLVIEESINTILPAAQAKEIRLQRVLDSGTSIVSGDPARLQQIVWNLLSNAIKFTLKGGRVQVSLERINSHVEIVISDSGVGIAPDVLPYVFERFRQADSSSTRAHGGLGLGLAIVRHLVELHGGSVEAHSEGQGQGAIFRVKLPLVAVRSFGNSDADTERRVHPTARQETAGRWPRLDGLHVLVVDDQEDTRMFLSLVLERCGARVSAAASAAAALDALRTLRPDVLVSDIGMPDEDGYSLIKRVRALPSAEGGQTPAAALTAFARVEDRIKALRSGFQIHLPKPVEPLELASVIANLAGRRDEE
ncbi:MAG TPA: PAS domain S-box protein [Abditibacterium sp.]|jgi:PAS domain S-box-containing protein